MKRIIVTGGSGKVGRATVRDLTEHGYTVVANLDIAPSSDTIAPFVHTDLTDFGETIDAFHSINKIHDGADAVVHLAAVPGQGRRPDSATFAINTLSTYNAFSAAAKLGMKRVVWASSETLLGLPFDREPPGYAPLDEDLPARPNSSYSLAKACGEEMARHFSRWHPDIPFIGLRFSNVMEPHDYASFATWQDDPSVRKRNLWGYVDARDCAQACRLALEADIAGAENFVIAAADTVMTRANQALMEEAYPGVEIRGAVGDTETLESNAKAERLLGYAPKYSWRDGSGEKI